MTFTSIGRKAFGLALVLGVSALAAAQSDYPTSYPSANTQPARQPSQYNTPPPQQQYGAQNNNRNNNQYDQNQNQNAAPVAQQNGQQNGQQYGQQYGQQNGQQNGQQARQNGQQYGQQYGQQNQQPPVQYVAPTQTAPAAYVAPAPQYAAPAPTYGAADIRAPSPRIMDDSRPGYFEAGIGPSFALGLGSDQPLYDLNAAYLYNFNNRVAGKVLGDFDFGSSSDTTRSVSLGLGLDYYLTDVVRGYGIPYVAGDVTWAFVRNAASQTVDAPALGAGAGFKFAAEDLNFDVNLHYEVVTAQLAGKTPSIIGLRAAVNF